MYLCSLRKLLGWKYASVEAILLLIFFVYLCVTYYPGKLRAERGSENIQNFIYKVNRVRFGQENIYLNLVVTLYSSPFGQRAICLMNFLSLNCYNSRVVLLYLWIFKFGILRDLSEKTFTLHWTFGLVLRSSFKNLTPKKVFCAGRPHSNLKSQYYID